MSLGRASLAVLCVAVPLAAGAARTTWSGREEWLASSFALGVGDTLSAITHARRAAAFYLPGAAHVDPAYERLADLAARAEARADRETALFAWRSMRAAAMESRWLVVPHARDLARADAAIARISADAVHPIALRDRKPEDLERMYAALLARDDAPRPGWVLVLVAGCAAWLAGGIWLVRRGLTPEGDVVPGTARAAAMLVLAGIAGWVVALWQA